MDALSTTLFWLDYAAVAVFGATGALAASKNPDAATAAIAGGQAVAVQNQLNFSRDMEREADRVGFGIMADAGFDKQGFASMFDKLEQASRLNDSGAFPYLRSHPLTTERIAEARGRLQLDSDTPAAAADEPGARMLHAMMAARARVLADPGVDGLRPLVSEAQRVAPQSAAAPALRARDAGALYAGALAASRLREPVLARSLAAQLQAGLAQQPANQEQRQSGNDQGRPVPGVHSSAVLMRATWASKERLATGHMRGGTSS